MYVWDVLHTARWKYRTQKIAKKSPSAHHRTILLGCIFATKACIDNRKKILWSSNISSTCLHNMANFGLLAAEICWRVWCTHQISTGFASWLRYCSDVAHRRPTKLCTTFGRLWASTLYIHCRGSCPLTEFCQVQNSLCVQVLRSRNYIGSVTVRHSSNGRQPNFASWCKEWNYGTFADGVTYIRLGGHHVGHRPTF